MLAFEGVTRRHGSTLALDDVSFTIERGSFTAIAGLNGAGKTTALRLAAQLDSPDRGSVRVDGAEGLAARRQVGWLGQEPGLYGDLTLRENLRFAADCFGPGRDVTAAARDAGIAHRLDERARRLSRGERQRGAIARAMLGGPLLLLDEPTTALDAEGVAALAALLTRSAGERTLVVATHDAELLKRADRVIGLDAGRLAT